MSNAPSQPKAGIGHYLAYGTYRILESALCLLPIEVACVMGAGMGQLGHLLMPKRRATVIRNLRIAYGDQYTNSEINSLAAKTFRMSGNNLIASIRASLLSAEELRKRVRIEGLERLLTASREGNGCILTLAHMGNWELLTQLQALAPEIHLPASIYRPLNNPLLDNLVKRRRESRGTRLFSKRDSFSKPIGHLKNGGMLGAVADQHAGVHGMAIPFFNKVTSMTSLPALLHRKTKAPIIPLSLATTGLGKWKVVVHPQIEVDEHTAKQTQLITIRCAKAYEQVMNVSPTDVLWMHGYWKVGRQFPLRIDGTQKNKNLSNDSSPPEPSSLLPFRMLVFLGNLDASSPEISSELSRLKHYRPDAEINIVGERPEHPDATATIVIDPVDPPHLVSHAIDRLDLASQAPVDCALDLTPDACGQKILRRAQLSNVYALRGKHQNRNTRRTLESQGSLTISQFLTTLGLPE